MTAWIAVTSASAFYASWLIDAFMTDVSSTARNWAAPSAMSGLQLIPGPPPRWNGRGGHLLHGHDVQAESLACGRERTGGPPVDRTDRRRVLRARRAWRRAATFRRGANSVLRAREFDRHSRDAHRHARRGEHLEVPSGRADRALVWPPEQAGAFLDFVSADDLYPLWHVIVPRAAPLRGARAAVGRCRPG